MHPSRTPVDWLIVIVNIPALLLGLAIGWMWIWEAVQHYRADDDHPNIRIGMCIGFIMSYLVWNTVVMTYVVLNRQPPAGTATAENAQALVRPVPVALPVRVPMEPSKASPSPVPVALPVRAPSETSKASPPPVRVQPASAAPPATPAPEWVADLARVHANVSDPAALPNPPPTSWLPDVEEAQDRSRRAKE